MGSQIELIAVGISQAELDAATAVARRIAESWEERFSRFRPHSELARLNAAAGSPVCVSPEFVTVLDAALAAYDRTGGRFDPTILPSLSALGYDRDFAELRTNTARPAAQPEPPIPDAVERIVIDRRAGAVTVPIGCALDFGGIAKGIFVDRLVDRCAHWPGGSINAGGDLRVWGEPPDGEHWIVGIEDPADATRECCLIEIREPDVAAVATSAMNRHVWHAGRERYHHLIDPASGRPVIGRLISATALAPDLETAEVATKALLVSDGRGQSLDLADATGAVVIDSSGARLIMPGRNHDAFTVHPLDSEAIPA